MKQRDVVVMDDAEVDTCHPELRPFLDNRVVVRLDVERTRTWDHRKLGLPMTELSGTTAASIQEM